MTSVAIGPMPPSGTDTLEPVVRLTKEPAGVLLEVRVTNQSSPTGHTFVGRAITMAQALELEAALGFLNQQTGRV